VPRPNSKLAADMAVELRRRLTPILGEDLAQDVSGNASMLYLIEDDPEFVPVVVAVRDALMQRLRNREAYRQARHLTEEMVDRALTAVEDMKAEDLRPNTSAGRPKGFKWPRPRLVYHATVAMDAVLDEGLKSRGELAERIHATGGGPDESISFAMDEKVTYAICLGLRTLAAAARGEMKLGQLIQEAMQLSPDACDAKLKEMRLTADDVAHIDRDLYRFNSGLSSYGGVSVKLERAEEMMARRPDLEFEAHQFDGATRPYAITGWAPLDIITEMQVGMPHPHVISEWFVADKCFDFYKGFLAHGDMMFKQVYDPLFFLTSPRSLARVTEDQIGIVSATLAADWICSDPDSAQQMGFNVSHLSRPYVFEWSRSCESKLRHGWSARPPTRDWDEPDASDTIAYLGALDEIRVYDRKLIRDLRRDADLDDVLNAARDAWDRKGVYVDYPIAWPYFKVRPPFIAG
jgi:hypothetical protein